MSAWGAMLKRGRRNGWAVARTILLFAGVAALLFLAVKIVFALARGQFDVSGGLLSWKLLLAGTVYLSSHALRILRLALLIGSWRVGFRVIAAFHLMTAAVSLVAPLKLGEVYRALELSSLVGGLIRAVIIVWWERAFDISLIFLILLLALSRSSGAPLDEFSGVVAISVVFILLTLLIFFVLPDNLRRASVLIIRRYDGKRTVPVLRLIDAVRRAINEAPQIVRGKIAALATLTALIWICEIGCFALVLSALGGSLASAPDALLSFLSAITRGQTLLSALDANQSEIFSAGLLAYLAVTQVPLAFIGLAAAIVYVGRQMPRLR
jgi:Lysylphosphatidylglycerol synthase TM region